MPHTAGRRLATRQREPRHHAPRERRPDRRRRPEGPEPDERATEHAIERLWAVVGR